MKKLQSIIAGLVLLGTISCSNKDLISISGEISNPGNVKVVAFYEGERKLDSVFLSDQNKFKFERQATQPRLMTVQIGNNKYPIILTPGEKLVFTADLQNDPEKYNVEGSELSTALQLFAQIKQRKDFLEDSLQNDFMKRIANKSEPEIESMRAEYLAKYRETMSYYTSQASAYAANQSNLAGFYAMSTLDPEVAETELINYADQIKDQFVDNRAVIQFKEEVDKLRKLAVGQPAPLFEAYTPDNKTVRLADYKGKYTLVDFWASWCVPCRKENPNLVRIYNEFKDKNFTILGVSLDNNPGSWMRAIEDDKLPWTNISDLKAWTSNLIIDYRIKAIPSSVLVDPNGIIIAKNLRSAQLEEFLKKTLK
ncbi:TlpA disulfide reductase family protein [Sphingobacterium rhinopitheci]|uniref:TlpA disulfide reductase family protein n=1 Tax=Sphingobacterium rhinopitheci TaxID=2781960 RepID=UPI001F5276CE|nr:TlpA disulfide reductase family protein [Sphingobacterium rhinopitheci]MCI0920210.1 AhpC/TSA family protein [Sphingobacterium rhinopitheci]